VESLRLCAIETLDGFDQADVAFADEVEQRQAEIFVVHGDFDHETQVALIM